VDSFGKNDEQMRGLKAGEIFSPTHPQAPPQKFPTKNKVKFLKKSKKQLQ